jgi:hypothetical protein
MSVMEFNDVYPLTIWDRAFYAFSPNGVPRKFRRILDKYFEDHPAGEREHFLSFGQRGPSYDIGVFAPSCMRSLNGSMKRITQEVADMCSLDIRYFVLVGGGDIYNLVAEHGKPRSVLGIACRKELNEGAGLLKNIGLESRVIQISHKCKNRDLSDFDMFAYRQSLAYVVHADFRNDDRSSDRHHGLRAALF